MRRRFLSLLLCVTMVMAMVMGCGKKDGGTAQPTTPPNETGTDGTVEPTAVPVAKTYKLKVSSIVAGIHCVPIYIAEEKGWFKDAGLDIERTMFSGGPVQVEAVASDSWDIGTTGIGGVLAGTIGQDVKVLAGCSGDVGTQYLFARKDSPIVAAGQGKNTVSDQIYGDAASWKNAEVLCSSGTALHITLAKTLAGFGLTTDDIKFTVMDAPSANTAFLAGEGDVAAVWAAMSFSDDKKDYVAVSNGTLAQTGISTNIIANPRSYADPEKREAMKIFLKVYMDTVAWMQENKDEAADYLFAFFEDDGAFITEDLADTLLATDPWFGLKGNHDIMNTKSPDGDYSVMEAGLLDTLNFFIATGNYKEGSQDKLLDNKVDPTLINEIYEEANK